MNAEHRGISGSAIVRACILLVGSGILWGWLWFSAVHTIPYLYVIGPAADIVAYGFVGTRVNEALRRYALPHRWRLMFAILAMMTFYISNRLIGLTLIVGVSSFTENSQSSARMLFESLVILVGLVTATGVWRPTRVSSSRTSHGEKE
ncbi:MAG TPA: hypothetical protein VFS96_06325 [Nitrolancea sp.]|nr:hypothetical protein [Nitrolancea sp.]